ncbi:hypothetical protein P3X46_017947 [Hevea brasiliensis]|uniref:Uncharacterized protein n=2 Tax=Hevea brasiliensis TaxID=3981 RepID=A0ABQ9LP88_HEVBR|nr:hypothetical protein P3X46_017947 [Hevea brasiliensis]
MEILHGVFRVSMGLLALAYFSVSMRLLALAYFSRLYCKLCRSFKKQFDWQLGEWLQEGQPFFEDKYVWPVCHALFSAPSARVPVLWSSFAAFSSPFSSGSNGIEHGRS